MQLYSVSRISKFESRRQNQTRLLKNGLTAMGQFITHEHLGAHGSCTDQKLVEPDGIEPTTSCLQSRRSPN